MNTRITSGFEVLSAGPRMPLDVLEKGEKFALTIGEWRRRHHFRTDLKRLLKIGPYMIDDIGLSLEETRRECDKPFWLA